MARNYLATKFGTGWKDESAPHGIKLITAAGRKLDIVLQTSSHESHGREETIEIDLSHLSDDDRAEWLRQLRNAIAEIEGWQREPQPIPDGAVLQFVKN